MAYIAERQDEAHRRNIVEDKMKGSTAAALICMRTTPFTSSLTMNWSGGIWRRSASGRGASFA